MINFAVSMGGNVGGYAVADASAVRADGTPLFDQWVAIEGVHDLTQEYTIVRGIEAANADAALARAEIERENGGPIEAVPMAYTEVTNTARAADMAYLKGVVLVHAQDDGLVPTEQSREMFAALNAVGVATHLYSVVINDTGERDTTASLKVTLESVGFSAAPTVVAITAVTVVEARVVRCAVRQPVDRAGGLSHAGACSRRAAQARCAPTP